MPAARAEISDLNDDAQAAHKRAYVKAMARLADAWGVTQTEIADLLCISAKQWSRIRQHPEQFRLNQDQLTRMSLLLGMFKSLNLVFSKPLADEWAKRVNTGALFGGQTPVQVMRAGGIPAMMDVRHHLDALRGGV
ncbi:antitoxin Xre-like helix-turn-helix domain-containing protein [Breoghania sp. L-A4]|uniref:antitoxin Xre-like helix-turn-helix domain-containing protein n=1 Tax=Breoghania sp. L-A4 TaxID=2304600 RepID=UPI0013C2CC21|nr:antitoxin Xre-like helix-turn-helix domain-containing protein [Breoghania sp. L-A4]